MKNDVENRVNEGGRGQAKKKLKMERTIFDDTENERNGRKE